MGVDRSLRVFRLSACLLSLFTFIYMCVCVLFDLSIHIHTINERKIAGSRLICQTRRRIARRERERERERERHRIRYDERQQRVVPILGKENKLSYCTRNTNNTITLRHMFHLESN